MFLRGAAAACEWSFVSDATIAVPLPYARPLRLIKTRPVRAERRARTREALSGKTTNEEGT